MKLTSRGHYGLRAMTELARAYGGGPIAVADIAHSENLSEAYLEQLMGLLRRAGLVESIRGARGGYRLTRHPSAVTVGEVVRALEGPIAPVECASEAVGPGCCERVSDCASRQLWQKVRDSIVTVLDSTTLADLCHAEIAFDAGEGKGLATGGQ